jgi:hypothetical protein
MSLEKAIKYNKEKRKPYRDSKAWDSSCRNHGSCSWCENNRLYSEKKRKASAKDQLDRYYDYYDEQ